MWCINAFSSPNVSRHLLIIRKFHKKKREISDDLLEFTHTHTKKEKLDGGSRRKINCLKSAKDENEPLNLSSLNLHFIVKIKC